MREASKNIVITGVSTGIGYESAKELIRRGYRVFGSVRKQEDANRLLRELGANYVPLIMDVTNKNEVGEAADLLQNLIGEEGLFCLINNSGIAIGGPLQDQSMKDIIAQFEVNVFGLLRVTKAFLPLLGAQDDASFPPGRIINISSVAGKIAAPFVGAYAGTKHAVEGLSRSLRRELLLFGIDVIVVGPGAVKTPIWTKGIDPEQVQDSPYNRVLGRFKKAAMNGAKKGLEADYLGKRIADIAESRQPKPRYAYVPSKWTNWTLPRLLPERMIDRVIKKNLFKL